MSEDSKKSTTASNGPAPSSDRVYPLGDNAGVYIAPEPDLVDSSQSREMELDFGGFIISLGTSGMLHLGKFEDPETGKSEIDLPAARNIIQILTMLEKKTRGNLETEEKQLIDSLIYDLRLAYVEATKTNS